MHNWKRHTYPHWVPDLGNEGYYGKKGQVEALKLTLPRKILIQKWCCIPGGFTEIMPPSRTWKRQGWWFPPHPYYLCLTWAENRCWRVTVDYYNFNQVVTPTAGVLDVVSVLVQISTCTLYPALLWQMPFSPSLCIKMTRVVSLQLVRTTIQLHFLPLLYLSTL